MDRHSLRTANFTAATTDVITSNSHGLKNGDPLVLTTSGSLPGGLSTGTVYYVRDATTNTFKLSVTKDGPEIDITSTGSGTHTFTMHDIGNSIFCPEFQHIVLSVDSASSANLTIKFQASISETMPDFSAAQTASNQWDYIDVKDYEDEASIDGDTGISLSGSDDHRTVMINSDHIRWVNCILTAWSAGNITVKASLLES
jgi:hypothetical protein